MMGNELCPITVAFNSGAGIRSKTPDFRSPKAKRLANSTPRCWISSSGFVVYPAMRVATRSCWAGLVVGREQIFVIAARTNWRMRKFAYGESRIEMIRSTTSASVIWEVWIFINRSYGCRAETYRFWSIFVHQTILKQNFAVFTNDPSSSESQGLLRDIGFQRSIEFRRGVRLEFRCVCYKANESRQNFFPDIVPCLHQKSGTAG